jgi:hypothetical protein
MQKNDWDALWVSGLDDMERNAAATRYTVRLHEFRLSESLNGSYHNGAGVAFQMMKAIKRPPSVKRRFRSTSMRRDERGTKIGLSTKRW